MDTVCCCYFLFILMYSIIQCEEYDEYRTKIKNLNKANVWNLNDLKNIYLNNSYLFQTRQMHSTSQATVCQWFPICIFWYTYPMSACSLTNLWVCWQGVNKWAFKGRRDRQVLSVLQFPADLLLSASVTPHGMRLGWVRAGVDTPALSVTLTDFSQ